MDKLIVWNFNSSFVMSLPEPSSGAGISLFLFLFCWKTNFRFLDATLFLRHFFNVISVAKQKVEKEEKPRKTKKRSAELLAEAIKYAADSAKEGQQE